MPVKTKMDRSRDVRFGDGVRGTGAHRDQIAPMIRRVAVSVSVCVLTQ